MRIIANHTITPQKTEGLFKVINNKDGNVYEVDIKKPNCSCKRFKYNKRFYTEKNKKGVKKYCKHLRMCEGIINEKT